MVTQARILFSDMSRGVKEKVGGGKRKSSRRTHNECNIKTNIETIIKENKRIRL